MNEKEILLIGGNEMGDEYIKRRDVLIKLEIAYDMARVDQKLPISDLQHEVNLIKAADVQPVKHGKWLKVNWNNYKCSLCDTQYAGMGAITFTYCPNCGALITE